MSSLIGQSTGLGNKAPSGYTLTKKNNFTPQQMQLFQQLFGQVSPDSFTGRLASGDQSQFDQLEAPAMRQFQGLQGQLASRFSQLAPGAMSARRGSGFQNGANQQTSDFAQDLSSRRMGLQQQAIMDLMGMSNQLLNQRPYDEYLMPKKKSFLQELGLSFANGAGQAASQYATGGF